MPAWVGASESALGGVVRHGPFLVVLLRSHLELKEIKNRWLESKLGWSFFCVMQWEDANESY